MKQIIIIKINNKNSYCDTGSGHGGKDTGLSNYRPVFDSLRIMMVLGRANELKSFRATVEYYKSIDPYCYWK